MKIFSILLLFYATNSLADCECECVNGKVMPLCESSLDITPICAPRICDILTPSIKPIQSYEIPPIGTSSCSNEQVFNNDTYEYEWQRVCR